MRLALLLLFPLLPAVHALDAQTRPVVIYLHGRIIEEQGPEAVSPDFGAYRYHAIVDSLRASGYEVLAEVRPKGADPDHYAAKVRQQVDSLIGAGVVPKRITVLGFSKGGGIAIRASALLDRNDVGFVFMGACGGQSDLRVAGRILSVYETSDELGPSCAPLFARARNGAAHEEVAISTGLRHGAFYQPRADWLTPVRAWIARSK